MSAKSPLAFALCLAACASAPSPALIEGRGSHHFEITTDSPRAQTWFDQGLVLCYGFNHDEAVRAFEEVARLDPDCAMAWWGQAY